MLNLCCYRLSIVHDLEPARAAVSGDMPLRVVAGSAMDKALHDALTAHTEVRVTLDVPEDGEAACKGTPLASSCPANAKKDREYPIGGDPKDFCACGHHEMCHANYADMPRSCNQTDCGCKGYRPEITDERATELAEAAETYPYARYMEPHAAFRDVATLLRELLDRRRG
jgi:hypothetical protein